MWVARGRFKFPPFACHSSTASRHYRRNLPSRRVDPRSNRLEQHPTRVGGKEHGEVSPDGEQHFSVVVAKLARMHAEELTLTPANLKNINCRTLVMVGDDAEVHPRAPRLSTR